MAMLISMNVSLFTINKSCYIKAVQSESFKFDKKTLYNV